ncbi:MULTISPECIES: DUF2474 domain-containing protein [Shewanella]|jgi:hypothetical protein|uniref:DUF2474 domain-containing protein n=1 Tax=Shewanella psychromarinicola TaxID=2487742 RepID=A0A3N4EA24_9GAMM|nr:DUF2474 domain-containing protein [Shewanella psychromarinicola]AZG37080.1 DUF2474 domain-containing protein [Shewanella psychromarinicola]MCL1082984.1 DUF2474 domain-containing protein [Shewanella psychromarinicola]RPA34933.1 DUF2474 domain-containing protein [Shewanella psychromarinicola]
MKLNRALQQWLWLLSIWVISVLSLGIVSMGFKLLMTAAGFKS